MEPKDKEDGDGQKSEKGMRNISAMIPEIFLDAIEIMCGMGFFATRSEALRAAVKDMIDRFMPARFTQLVQEKVTEYIADEMIRHSKIKVGAGDPVDVGTKNGF